MPRLKPLILFRHYAVRESEPEIDPEVFLNDSMGVCFPVQRPTATTTRPATFFADPASHLALTFVGFISARGAGSVAFSGGGAAPQHVERMFFSWGLFFLGVCIFLGFMFFLGFVFSLGFVFF
ncbi:hypothetical protein B0T25DRAFT_528473 [Lasiosphaeria hispida]|uniref:Transmembrane protein n=1 Tax=Lasiosphaeria hispida TaxID=260671 RepID=A0AAJ0HWE1_9PEZI|nr:hypothetical protein B0T25DRAFT_528473 [Lasiosphaeria hispida]